MPVPTSVAILTSVLTFLLPHAASADTIGGPLQPHSIDVLRTLDRVADVVALRGRDEALVLRLRPERPYAPDVVIVGDGYEDSLPRTFLAGSVAHDPTSLATLFVGESVTGFVTIGARTLRLYAASDRTLAWDEITIDDEQRRRHPAGCAGAPLVPPSDAAISDLPARLLPPGSLREIDIAFEVQSDLVRFLGSQRDVEGYVGMLVAAINEIYRRDLRTRLRVRFLRLWPGGDPWDGSTSTNDLMALRGHWVSNAQILPVIGFHVDAVLLLTQFPANGGLAYVGAVCRSDSAFGISGVYGNGGAWDLTVVAHELGHLIGTPHTHCYQPPLDRCYNAEQGCYAGPVVQSRGTLMSYCHLAGGIEAIDVVFPPPVQQVVTGFMDASACIAQVVPQCGDGFVDGGEECDVGDRANFDGCSADCRIEGVCGDGRIGPHEQCEDGNTVDGDCCNARCTWEAVGSACADDANACTADACDGAGICGHQPLAVPCDDLQACTFADTCATGQCVGSPASIDGALALLPGVCTPPGRRTPAIRKIKRRLADVGTLLARARERTEPGRARLLQRARKDVSAITRHMARSSADGCGANADELLRIAGLYVGCLR